MKPGDPVRIVNSDDEKLPDDILGHTGVIVEPVTLEDGHPINSWCDWWVLIDGEMQPWAEENLEVIVKPGDLVRISYAGKPYHPDKTGWRMTDDHGYPGLDGKIGISLYEHPHVTSAGNFWTLLVSGETPVTKLIHEEYCELINETG